MIEFSPIVAAAEAAPAIELRELTGEGTVLVLAPHPDDESLAMGGAIVAASEAGHDVQVVVVADGSRSHPGSKSHPPDALAALRRSEVERAVGLLTNGRRAPIWLGYPDLAAPDDKAAFAVIASRLGIHDAGLGAIWTTWEGDPHPDHQRTYRLARYLAVHAGCRLFACPVWGRLQKPVPGARFDGLRRFETAPWQPIKRRAVAAHASQMTRLIDDDPDGFMMPPELAAHFVESDEIFIPA